MMSTLELKKENISFNCAKDIVEQLITSSVIRSEERRIVTKPIIEEIISSAVFSSELEKRKKIKIQKYKIERQRQNDIEKEILKGAISE